MAARKLRRICFVVSPMGEEGSAIRKHADHVVRNIIRPALGPARYRVARMDHLGLPGLITQEMVELLGQADLVVADVTGGIPAGSGSKHPNPNVMYELGIRHAWCLPAIQIAHEKTDLPFDIRGINTIKYGQPELPQKQSAPRRQLKRQLRQVERGKGAIGIFTSSFRERARPERAALIRNQYAQELHFLGRSLDNTLWEIKNEKALDKGDALAALVKLLAKPIVGFEAACRVFSECAEELSDPGLDGILGKSQDIFKRWKQIADMVKRRSSKGAIEELERKTELLIRLVRATRKTVVSL